MGVKIDVVWEVCDGYVGKSRPQHSKIDISEFDSDMSDAEIEQTILDYVQEDFEERISWDLTYGLSEEIGKVRAALEREEE